jgi:hypothetical protein
MWMVWLDRGYWGLRSVAWRWETRTHRRLAEMPEPSFGLPFIDRLSAAFLVLLHCFSSVLPYHIS